MVGQMYILHVTPSNLMGRRPGRARVRAVAWAFVVVTLALALALAPAQAQSTSSVVLVVYHVTPDTRAGTADADPFSAASAAPDVVLAAHLPATRVDGVLEASGAPEGDPANPAAHTRELQRLLDERAAAGAPVELDITGNSTSARIVATGAASGARIHAALLRDGAIAKGRIERDL